jgi:hypothetical protein
MTAMLRSLARAAAAALMIGGAALLATPATASARAMPAPMNVTPFAGLFHVINPVAHSNMCLQPFTPTYRSVIVERPCDGSAAQEWAILSTPSGGTHYRFLNNSGFCLWVDDGTVTAGILREDECQTSAPGSTTVSNAEWNSSALQPNAVTLQSRLGFVNRNLCLTDEGPGFDTEVSACDGTVSQIWLIGFGG